MRTTKKERKENAKRFYNMFMNGSCKKAAIVVTRLASKTNPNINRCQFLAVPSTLAFAEKPIIIAESNVLGVEGCFMELLGFVKPCIQKGYYDNGFNEWLIENYGFEITYKDGLVFMLEKR